MCAIMDDVLGWTAFCVTGKCIPWSGYTVQVNTKLTKPVPVDSFLKVVCNVTKVERRKVFMTAQLVLPTTDNCNDNDNHNDDKDDNDPSTMKEHVHAKAEGLVILNHGILPNIQ